MDGAKHNMEMVTGIMGGLWMTGWREEASTGILSRRKLNAASFSLVKSGTIALMGWARWCLIVVLATVAHSSIICWAASEQLWCLGMETSTRVLWLLTKETELVLTPPSRWFSKVVSRTTWDMVLVRPSTQALTLWLNMKVISLTIAGVGSVTSWKLLMSKASRPYSHSKEILTKTRCWAAVMVSSKCPELPNIRGDFETQDFLTRVL